MELASVCLLPKNHPSSKYANAKQKITFVKCTFVKHMQFYTYTYVINTWKFILKSTEQKHFTLINRTDALQKSAAEFTGDLPYL